MRADDLPAASRTVTAAAPAAVPGAEDPVRAPAPVSAMPLAIRLVMAPADLDNMAAMTAPGSAFTPAVLPVGDAPADVPADVRADVTEAAATDAAPDATDVPGVQDPAGLTVPAAAPSIEEDARDAIQIDRGRAGLYSGAVL